MAFPYSLTANDLLARFEQQKLVEITDTTHDPPTTRDDAKIETAANDAANELELYASQYYTIPLSPFTSTLRPLFLDLWAWRLLFNCKPDWLSTDRSDNGFSWSDRRKELLGWLKDLQNGKATLPGMTEIGSSSSSGGAWATSGEGVMTRTNLLRLP